MVRAELELADPYPQRGRRRVCWTVRADAFAETFTHWQSGSERLGDPFAQLGGALPAKFRWIDRAERDEEWTRLRLFG